MHTAADDAKNVAVIRRLFEEVFNQGRLEVLDEIVAAEYVGHDPTHAGGGMRGRERLTQTVTMFRMAFPDLHLTMDDTITAGDKVVVRWTLHGTHKGPWMSIAPTGRAVAVMGIIIYRLAGGQIVEYWGSFDQLGLLRQLGAAPAPERRE